MEKFKMHFLAGGYVRITWKDIEVASGRPWITDPHGIGYSALVLALWDDPESCDRILDQLSE